MILEINTTMPFDGCNHIWKFQINADKAGIPGNKPWCSFFICDKCKQIITLQEKCALEELEAHKNSLKIQERQTKTSMRANIIAAATLIVAFIVLLLGDSLIGK